MKILALSDVESRSLWDHFDRRKLDGVEMILSCGDLDPDYLSFLATFTSAPLLYVHGNHDGRYAQREPGCCVCVDGKIHVHNGVRVLGLGGCMRYKPSGQHQYTAREMDRRVRRLWLALYRHGGFDILLTHAPALGVNDGSDLAHTGFECFNRLIDRYTPRYFVHGHVHISYGRKHPRLDEYGSTKVINAYESYMFEY